VRIKVIFLIFILTLTQQTCFGLDSGATGQADALFLNGDYSEAASKYEKALDEKKIKSEVKHNAEYKMALCYLKLGRAQEANDLLAMLLSKDLSDNLKPDVKMAYADSLVMLDKLNEAAAGYEDILKHYPAAGIASTVNFKLAELARKAGQWEKAKALYRGVAIQYLQSFEAGLAQDILINGDFFFSVQVGSYTKRENAQQLVDELKQKGYDAHIKEYKADSLKYYRVRVGRCEKKEEALELESRLKQEELPTKIFP